MAEHICFHGARRTIARNECLNCQRADAAALRSDLAAVRKENGEGMEMRRATIERLKNDLMDMSETIVNLRTVNEGLHEALVSLLEDAEDMRRYADDWTWKYGKGWDETLAKAREVIAAALTPSAGAEGGENDDK